MKCLIFGDDSSIVANLATPYANPFDVGDGDTIEFEFATLTIEGYGLGAIGSADIRATFAFDTGLNSYIGEGSGVYASLFSGFLMLDTFIGLQGQVS